MSGEGARSGVKHPGPRARVARQPTPATQTILYQGLGFMDFSCAPTLAFLKLVLGFKLESRVASALFGPSACQGP